MSEKLKNIKHETFCCEYIIDFNITQAAIRAGYSEKQNSASTIGHRLLQNVEILARIKVLLKERAERLCLTGDNVLLRAINVYEKCMQEHPVMQFNYITKELEHTGEYQFDSKGALKALEIIARLQGMFNDKLKVEAQIAPLILDNVPRR